PARALSSRPWRPRASRPSEKCGLALVAAAAVLTAGNIEAQSSNAGGVTFTAAARQAGLLFEHVQGGSGERYMVETMGGGVAVADLDGDGWLDVYFVQSAATPGYVSRVQLLNLFYRNRGDGTFADASIPAKLGDDGYGLGAAGADFDNDGFTDLYITNFGANRLYRNNGDGSFTELGNEAGVDDARWGASAAWADIDNDGDLDLYVCNYVDFTWDNHKFCGNPRRNLRAYCHPDVYNGLTDLLYRNDGNGHFTDISEAAGVANALEGKGLGAVFGDADDDGYIDLYVANDSTRNFLYVNQGDGTFVDDALLAGVGYSEDGKAEAGMGTDWGDYDGDGRLDVVVTNLDLETNTLYRSLGRSAFADVTFAAGLGEPSLLYVGFGTNWVDFDNDTDLDLFVANGHIIDNIASFKDNVTYAQPNHMYLNDGAGGFTEIHERLGSGLALVKVSRGSAVGDMDGDGDVDIVVGNNNQSADYLRNDGGNQAGHWLQLRLVGTSSNRTAAGARATVTPLASRPASSSGRAPGLFPHQRRPLIVEVRAGSSYCSSSAPTLYLGLGAFGAAEVGIRWPGGANEELGRLAADRLYVVRQGHGVVASR
ncbi:MAG: CRTAC1 family protein, partial [Acidobacteriota bacterium]